MNSRVSWSVDGIDPSVRERAEAAARRAGMSLNEWLASTIGDVVAPNFRNASDLRAAYPSRDVADIHQRLDAITRHVEQIWYPSPRNDVSREQGVARQLNEAISRLDARLAQISKPQDARLQERGFAERPEWLHQPDPVERAAGQVYRSSQPFPAASLDMAIAEIAARQSELDGAAPQQVPPREAPPIAPATPAEPDFSSLERHLLKITSQIEALQRPDDIDQSIAAFRNELSDIRLAITEAMPRRAIESIENEVRSLARRIDDSRPSAIDGEALINIEHALAEIRQVLRSLMSAEQLAGYDEAIRNLTIKLDTILRASDDPATVQQLENAIVALRAIVSNIASNDALARLSDDVHLLSGKVDQLTRGGEYSNSFTMLEQRIASLMSALESREWPQPSVQSEQLETALRALSDRIDRLPVGSDNASAFAHIEQRIAHLLERLDAPADPRAGNLSRVEEALQDILGHLERQHAAVAKLADEHRVTLEPQYSGLVELVKRELSDIRFSQSEISRQTQDSLQDILGHLERQHAAVAKLTDEHPVTVEPQDPALIELVKRELSDIRFSQTETSRHTQDSLEVVHNALGHVVDRLSMIEGDLRSVRTAPVAAPASTGPAEPLIEEPRAQIPLQAPPEPSRPAAHQTAFVAAPREFHAATAEPAAAPLAPSEVTAAPPPPLLSEILVPQSAPPARPAIAPELPPDHPLEPGTRPGGRTASPSERIAASEYAISDIPAAPRPPVSSSSFIAAARRAAQAAAAQQLAEKGRAPSKPSSGASKDKKEVSSLVSKIRSVLVAASVVVIVLGTFKMAVSMLESSNTPAADNSAAPQTPSQLPTNSISSPPAPTQVAPSMTSPSITAPTPIGRQSQNDGEPGASDTTASIELPQDVVAPLEAAADVTAAVPPALADGGARKLVSIAPAEKLPDAIGGPVLRVAALKGDAAAAYEIAVRFAEGKGVTANLEEAAKWYDRAARAGIVPAIFRLGTLYEKGMGVKRDPDTARRYYLQAAERGSAKAMHNLAVLDADGGGKGANYHSAAQWFRKAADRGVADSQFNLGILYARGIGVEQNLAESFKWFSLAAAQGDADAARKRDDIAGRLDVQSLAAAKLAIQTFAAEPQPDDAVNVAAPAGGWDSTPIQATPAKPMAKPGPKRTAAVH